jgi:hypothetical protein
MASSNRVVCADFCDGEYAENLFTLTYTDVCGPG